MSNAIGLIVPRYILGLSNPKMSISCQPILLCYRPAVTLSFYNLYPSMVITMLSRDNLLDLVHQCRNEQSLDLQINLLFRINESLPDSLGIKIPSLITNDYVSRALDIIEDKLDQFEPKKQKNVISL